MGLKLCFWMDMPSHHQQNFLQALQEREDVVIQVRYEFEFSEDRKKLGWRSPALSDYEKYSTVAAEILDPALQGFIHIIPGIKSRRNKELVRVAASHRILWCHWSKRSGIRVARFVHYNRFIMLVLYPFLVRILKWHYARIINKTALVSFAQGILARRDQVTWGVRPELIQELYYAVAEQKSTGTYPKIETFKKGRNAFFMCGTLSERKGVKVLLEAFYHLHHAEDWVLVLVGNGELAEHLRENARALGIQERVLLLGVVPSDEVGLVYGSCDVFVLPTLYDGWGVVLNEAAYQGKPIISTDMCGAAWHLIDEGRNGYRVKSGSANTLKNAMQRYVDDETLIVRHGRESVEIAHTFSPVSNAERMCRALYKSLESRRAQAY